MADGGTRVLLMLVARDEDSFDHLVTGLLDVGITGATVVESRGLGAIIRQDMPIFAGLAALLPQQTGSKVILSITTRGNVEALQRFVEELPESQRPIGAAVPVDQTIGLANLGN